MNNIFYQELREKCNAIHNDKNNSYMTEKILDAYERVIFFQKIARKEGLLALEEACEKLDITDRTQAYMHKLIMLIVDGTEPEMLKEIGLNMIIANAMLSCEGFICLMYYIAVLMIQNGENPFVIKQFMKSMMPDFILAALNKRECEEEVSEAVKKEKEKDLIKSLCGESSEINEKDYSIVNQTAITLIMLSNQEIQRILREIDNIDIVLAMKGFIGKARARIFDNLSNRLGNMIAEDVIYSGPARLCDVEESCVKIMKTVILLENRGEIASHDFTTLKVVLDMYEASQKVNQELKEKYKGVKELVDEIYRL